MTYESLEGKSRREAAHYSRSTMRRAIAGSAMLSVLLSGCTTGQDPEPIATHQTTERPAPDSDKYFHDTTDPYYRNVGNVLAQTNDPVARANMEKIMETPIAQWLNVPADQAEKIIDENIRLSKESGGIPMFVAYNIPFRDLGGDARGGTADGQEYKEWITRVSETIGEHPSIVILEPDALTGVPQIERHDVRSERIDLLRHALGVFNDNNPNTAVYLDAGHSKWLSVGMLVELLKEIDTSGDIIHGISLNVSNQRPEDEIRDYAEQIWDKLGYKAYVMIDNSMNGAPNTADLLEWCNVDGEKIGSLDDTYFDKDNLVEEAYIKVPGESDGVCGTSREPSGRFDNELLRRQVSE